MADNSLDSLFAKLAEADESSDLNSRDLLSSLMRQFGGESGFSERLKELFDESGSESVRARIATALLDLTVQNSKIDNSNEIAALSDEELKTELGLFVREMVSENPDIAKELMERAAGSSPAVA